MTTKMLFTLMFALGVFAASTVAVVSMVGPSYANENTGNDN